MEQARGNTATSGDMLMSYSSDINAQANTKTYAHSHPLDEGGTLEFRTHFGLGTLSNKVDITGGMPSPQDYKTARDGQFRQIMVDKTFIYLYNSDFHQTIRIPRK